MNILQFVMIWSSIRWCFIAITVFESNKEIYILLIIIHRLTFLSEIKVQLLPVPKYPGTLPIRFQKTKF